MFRFYTRLRTFSNYLLRIFGGVYTLVISNGAYIYMCTVIFFDARKVLWKSEDEGCNGEGNGEGVVMRVIKEVSWQE